MQSKFIINHVGYLPNAPKRLVYHGDATEFTVYQFIDCQFIPLWTAPLIPFGEDELDKDAKIGDFSKLTAVGIYRLGTNEGNSRCFIVGENVYDTVARMLVTFFNWQRCGDSMGWNGICHADDRIVLGNGEERSLRGGHHESSDLRKWTFGTSLGMIGFVKYALRVKPEWDINILESEIRHCLKYYLALVSDEGYLYDSSFTSEGDSGEYIGMGYGDYDKPWQKRQYFDRPAPIPCHFQAIQLFSLCSRYFTEIAPDKELSEKCLVSAQKIYRYMITTEHYASYKLPIYPPLGHIGMEYYYAGFYADSALYYGGLALAAIELYRVSFDDSLYKAAHTSLKKLFDLLIKEGPAKGCFMEAAGSKQFANNYFYFYCTGIPQAYVAAAELWPEDSDCSMWLDAIRIIAEQNLSVCGRNAYNRVPVSFYAKQYSVYRNAAFAAGNVFDKHYSNGTAKINGELLDIYYGLEGYCYNLDVEAMAIFLKKAGELLEKQEYTDAAQNQLDWILGANRFDASNVTGVGYNVPHRGIYGEFFPPVPQIPGGVFIGYTDECFDESYYGMRNEYDSPMVGWLLYLFSELVD